MQRDIKLTRFYPDPPERIWRALTDPKALGQWFMENDLVPELNRSFTFRMKPQRGWDGITYCQVLELDAPRRVAFSYRGRASGEKVLACAGVRSETADAATRGVFTELDTVLSFTLSGDCGGGTRLEMEHAGFRGYKQVLVSFVMGMGWKQRVLPRLTPLLAKLAQEEATAH